MAVLPSKSFAVQENRHMTRVYGLDCEGRIILDSSVRLGERLICPHCDAELRVSRIDPPAVDWVYDWLWVREAEEDW